ncbi:hypothetical protein [Candidatus Villigracilis affinis]|uniref:hypothetical protein n=1 Tax=Candidatus Villigracilis affinis TaxID=3140682 RepID=UPI001DB87963|nr:hypothetical protein [Anaerolineales bacterium]
MEDSINNIKAVLFDLDGTLRHHLPSGGEVFVEYVRSMGFQVSEEDRIRAEHWEHFYFASSLEIRKDSETYKDDRSGFWVNFGRRRLVALGLKPPMPSNSLRKYPRIWTKPTNPRCMFRPMRTLCCLP